MSQIIDDIRTQIDALDDRMHDLLMERAALAVKIGEEKRRNKTQIVQPGREALLIRRLLKRHDGPLPREALVRIWRELVGALSLLQSGLKVVVTVPDNQNGLTYWDLAKDYFSSVLPMHKVANPLAALAMVREGESSFCVLPRPADGEPNPWWAFLLAETGDNALRITARLPFGNRSAGDGNAPEHQALVVARANFETTGDDRSFIALELDTSVSRARIVDKSRALGLEALSLYSAPSRTGAHTWHLLEVDKFVAGDDDRLQQLLTDLDVRDGRAVCVGGYPVPPVYDDKVGKSAPALTEAKDAPPAAKKSA